MIEIEFLTKFEQFRLFHMRFLVFAVLFSLVLKWAGLIWKDVMSRTSVHQSGF